MNMAMASHSKSSSAASLRTAGDRSRAANSVSPKAPSTPKKQLTYDSEQTKLETWSWPSVDCSTRYWYWWLKAHVRPISTATPFRPKKNTAEPGGSVVERELEWLAEQQSGEEATYRVRDPR